MTDAEQQPLRPLSTDEEALLRELGRVMIVLPRVIDADMMREQRIPVSEYTTLMHLSEAPHRLMRMNELAAACNLSLSGMTRVVTRLETQGLVARTRCDEDARGWNAVLTDEGLARLEQAWPAHLASARRHVFDHLEGADLARLTQALRRIAT
ncbi:MULTISPECIES: MarR family winged helix-turn-helix transcriptional regulator [unclassified Streptomyces]|uniref:MarR family winged helix-turn-helix transcriptional regulator n=1 Tax=unclassified Streptomyces TaxID=2593676 RepID=UPI0028C487F6|nr:MULTISPECIES: MarR family winged helix-turn-helix transcriptional regulator [unclassified Streptomyces]WNO71275.1 MarR family winged helix-turn-helix transcriptional regulator [Streptomyces sp. AM8-1-1]